MYYIIVLVLLFLTELFYFKLANKFNIIDKPNERSSHRKVTLRGGGIIFYFGALVYFLANHWEYPWFIVAFTEPALINTVLCSVLVFCFFNFRKKAKCFAGDVGSVSIAFILLFLIGRLIIKTEDFSWIILLSVYGVDTVLTIIHRLILHENIGLPHRKHMYQLMANELKMSHVMVSFIYMVVQTVVIVGYIMCLNYGYWYLFGTVLLLSLLYICFINKYFELHQLS